MPELHRSAVTRVAGTARSQQAHLVISAVRQPLWQPLRRRVVIAMLLWAATAGAFLAVADLPQMMASLSRYEGKGLALFVLLTLGGYTLRLLKWDYLLRMEGIVMSRKDSSLVFLSGLAMAVTPAKAGELLKAYLVHQVHGAAASAAVPVVIAERVTDVAALALLAGAGALQFRYGVEGVAATLAVVAGVIVILRSSRWTSPASVVLGRFRPAARILPMMREMQHSTRRVFGMIPLVNTTILSVCAWALECTILYLLFAGVGFPQSFLVSSFTFAFAAVAGTLSLAPGGVGVAEGSLVASMLWLGVPLEPAVTVAVLLRVVTFWLGLILGVASLAIVSRRLARSVPSGRRIEPDAAGG